MYSFNANVIARVSKLAFVGLMRLKDCIMAHESTCAMRRNGGVEMQQARGTAAMALDVGPLIV